MFRVECFCDDVKLHKVLRNLVGLAIGIPTAQPVDNAAKKNGRVVARGNGNISDMLLADLHSARANEIVPKQLKQWLEKHGKSPNSYCYVLRNLIEQGHVRKVVKKGVPVRWLIQTLLPPAARKGGH